MDAREALRKYFGFADFRGPQEQIIEHVMGGGHALVIMPTGMGKSLCYQIPAMLMGSESPRPTDPAATPPDLTLVVSPLIALMKDQVDALTARGIAANFINSSLSRSERESRYRQVAQGHYRLLYVTPERFRKPDFVDVIRQRKIRLLAVDEAHCISQWGHDFRPDYTRLKEIRELLGLPTTIALTATATPEVQRDIARQLGLESDQLRMFHEGIDRPNLSLEVVEVWDDDTKLDQICRLRGQQPGSGIVYCTLIKTLLRLHDRLRELDTTSLIYHGELERRQRRKIQEQFMTEPGHLVLATNAFGMGIDKEDIRLVAHAEVPGSLESYYQEIGRAGRDGQPSQCVLLYDQHDLMTHMEFLRWSNPDAAFYQRLYDYLLHDAEQVRAFGIEWLRERLQFKEKHDRRLETALAMLDRYGVLEGSLEPFGAELVSELPEALRDQSRLDDKLRRDQEKLYAVVQYVQYEGDRKKFLHEYFGLP